ncbi:MAG: hypothetical protein Q4G27_05415 [Flavobacteriaceae bacterium]|nr:hypothetical protein [Flavobacteriaceae bacterium]
MKLIISASNDAMTNEICAWLLFQKKPFVRLNMDNLIRDLYFNFDKEIFELTIEYEKYNLKNFESVYYRNGTIGFFQNYSESDENLITFFNEEIKSLKHFIYFLLEHLNIKIFGNLNNKEVNKLEVLMIAKKLGWKIPETHLLMKTNNIQNLNSEKEYINKSISEVMHIFHDNKLYLNYTKEVRLDEIDDDRDDKTPFFLQEKIKKYYELRIFFFEENVWAIATFDFSNEIDVRNNQTFDKKYLQYALSPQLNRKILLLSKTLNLNTGTMDILSANNEYYFLEVNPLGQFEDLNYFGGYDISRHIANCL